MGLKASTVEAPYHLCRPWVEEAKGPNQSSEVWQTERFRIDHIML